MERYYKKDNCTNEHSGQNEQHKASNLQTENTANQGGRNNRNIKQKVNHIRNGSTQQK